MFSFRTSFCCCGCPLEGGTIVLLITNLIFYLILMYFSFGEGKGVFMIFITAILFATKVAGLYGVNKKKPGFIIPHMVTQVMSLIAYGILIITILFARSMLEDIIQSTSNHSYINPSTVDLSFLDSFVFLVIFVFVLLFGLQYHFFLVVLSYFFKLKEGNAANTYPAMRMNNPNYP